MNNSRMKRRQPHFWLAALLALSWLCACATTPSVRAPERQSSRSAMDTDDGGGGGFGSNSVEARITHLIAEGQFKEAEALLADASSSGLVDQSTATALRKAIADQSMKLGEIPASLQRVSSFPARLRDFTRFELQKMLDEENFAIATKKELQTALKLIKEYKRLMQKN